MGKAKPVPATDDCHRLQVVTLETTDEQMLIEKLCSTTCAAGGSMSHQTEPPDRARLLLSSQLRESKKCEQMPQVN
jgi:hypothetical protein